MNKKYISFGELAFVKDENDKIISREYEQNFKMILEEENIIELLNKIKNEDLNNKKEWAKKIKYLNLFSKRSAWSLYILIAIYIFLVSGLIFSLGCLIIASIFTNIAKILVKHYSKKIRVVNYRIDKLTKILEETQQELIDLKLKEKSCEDLVYNEYIEINDEERLKRIERDLYLAYLYKLKEDIIKKKILEGDIYSYLDDMQINDDYLTEEDKNVILEYANEKKRILKNNI